MDDVATKLEQSFGAFCERHPDIHEHIDGAGFRMLHDGYCAGYREAYEKGRADILKQLLASMRDWAAVNAYDSDKGVCDEHTVDDCRGRVCSAQELIDFFETDVTKLL